MAEEFPDGAFKLATGEETICAKARTEVAKVERTTTRSEETLLRIDEASLERMTSESDGSELLRSAKYSGYLRTATKFPEMSPARIKSSGFELELRIARVERYRRDASGGRF